MRNRAKLPGPRIAVLLRGLVIGMIGCAGAPAWAAQADSALPVAATVNGDPIYVSEVDALLGQVARGGGKNTKESARGRADALKQLVNRRLAAQALSAEGGYYSEAEIAKVVENLKAQAAAQKMTFEDALAKQNTTLDAIRHQIIWQIAWDRYCERHLTDGLEGYFKEHHKEFDGTQVRASHILLRPDRAGEPREQLVEKAKKIRQGIEDGKASFEQAVERFSAGPSRAQEGDVGFFPRFGAMVEDFSKAAFALDKGQISEPVVTPFGVHLIKVTDIKPGTKQWTEVVDQIRLRAAVDLFEKLAEKEMAKAQIEYTGKSPYYKPGTNEIVMPNSGG